MKIHAEAISLQLATSAEAEVIRRATQLAYDNRDMFALQRQREIEIFRRDLAAWRDHSFDDARPITLRATSGVMNALSIAFEIIAEEEIAGDSTLSDAARDALVGISDSMRHLSRFI